MTYCKSTTITTITELTVCLQEKPPRCVQIGKRSTWVLSPITQLDNKSC